MINTLKIWSFVIALICMGIGTAPATVIEVGDLNIIDDPGNPSDGLQYLDMSYSVGLDLDDALANAQATYPNARLATPSEWDDLFDASSLVYTDIGFGVLKASDAFTAGGSLPISFGTDYNTSLRDLLGTTTAGTTSFWSDPDGDGDSGTTRDVLVLTGIGAGVNQANQLPADDNIGWLLVLDSIIEVDIDIKPGSYPNCFNSDGHGAIPVAILSTEDFDATLIDPLTVVLDGQAVRLVGKGNLQAHIEDVNADGLDDLVVQVEDIDGTYESGDTMATLVGNLYDGTAITGTDSICITQ